MLDKFCIMEYDFLRLQSHNFKESAMDDHVEYQSVRELLGKESKRLKKTDISLNVSVAKYYALVSDMIPPQALIHRSQGNMVLEMLFRLLDYEFKDTCAGSSEEAAKLREAAIFLGAVSTF